MEEEKIETPVETPQAEEVIAETPKTEEQSPDVPRGTEEKKFTQAELNRILAADKRRERAENAEMRERLARLEGEAQALRASKVSQGGGEPSAPKLEDFGTYEEYTAALVDFKANALVEKKIAAFKQEIAANTPKEDGLKAVKEAAEKRQKLEQARIKYEDFEDVVMRTPQEGGPVITQSMADAIMGSEAEIDLVYHLGKNPEEAFRIAQLPNAALQAKAIGRLEAKIVNTPPLNTPITGAPPVIKPVGTGNVGGTIDTSKMSPGEFIRLRNAGKI